MPWYVTEAMHRRDIADLGFGRLEDRLDSLREGIQVLSPEWRYLYVNEAVALHGRKARAELLGHSCWNATQASSARTSFRS